jgi:hypothetical protein
MYLDREFKMGAQDNRMSPVYSTNKTEMHLSLGGLKFLKLYPFLVKKAKYGGE